MRALAKIFILLAGVTAAGADSINPLSPFSPTPGVEGKTGSSGTSELANMSTRGFVLEGENVIIGGFVLGGSDNNTSVVVRGIGPSLTEFGLTPVLDDPALELYDSNGTLLISNNDWQDNPAQASQLISFGLAPQNAKESALVTSLPPGAFTAILAGTSGGTGVGMVELYNVH